MNLKELIEKINVIQLFVVLFCGVGLIMAICYGTENLSMAIASGLIGYLGGVVTSSNDANKNNGGDEK